MSSLRTRAGALDKRGTLYILAIGVDKYPNLPGNELRASTVVPWARFQLALEAAKGRRILFLDTCHSGSSYNQRLTNDA